MRGHLNCPGNYSYAGLPGDDDANDHRDNTCSRRLFRIWNK